CASETVVDFFW
nr:immunoglobulin heavy chain junction region [Macaca mulatta]